MFGCTFRRIQLKNNFQSSPLCRPQSAPEDRAQTDAKVQVGPLALQNLGAGGSGGGRLRRGWIDLDCRAVLELNLGLSGQSCNQEFGTRPSQHPRLGHLAVLCLA